MPVEMNILSDTPPVLEIIATGRIEKADYEQLVPAIEALIEQRGRVRMLIELRDFEGWTAGALWEDLKFDYRHFSDIERIVVIGESAWAKGVTAFYKPFTRAEVRFRGPDELEEARDWLVGAPERDRAGTSSRD